MTAPLASTRMPWRFVLLLSTAQLISWGTVFYGYAVLMEPMMRDLGWSRPQASAAFSVGLVASAVAAVPVGRLIDLGYGRSVMAGGSILAAALLALWSRVESYALFLALWVLLGATMSAVLYEPGFAVLQRQLGPLARRGITVMTLLGGLASTAFIPLTHVLVERFGWRPALLVLAAFNLLVCAVIHLVVIPPQAPRTRAERTIPPPSNARRVLRQAAFWGFVATVVIQGILSTGMPIHLLPLLSERGFSLDAAVAAYAVIGPAQTSARFAVGWAERALGIRTIGLITLALGVTAQALLPFVPPGSWTIVIFAVLYGASNGLMTILRALLPVELFGRGDYGTILGMIAAPANLARASGPFIFGALWAWWGSYDAVVLACLVMALGSLAAYLVTLAAARERHREPA
ncbi:MAG TPA: MFS transporter [Microvirga sp.]|nr:MFS transporter [Microvirga sp.]